MGALAERPGRDAPHAAQPESLVRHLRHWLRDRLVVFLNKLLLRSRKLYDGPSPDEADAEGSDRGRRESRRSESAAGTETAAAASGAPPPAKRRWGWILSTIGLMYVLGGATGGFAVVWYYDEAFVSADKRAESAVKEAKTSEVKARDAQRAIGSCQDDVAIYKSMHQSDLNRINQLNAALRNRGVAPPPPLPATSGNAPAAASATSTPAASLASSNDGCTLTGANIGDKFKSCVDAMNAGKR